MATKPPENHRFQPSHGEFWKKSPYTSLAIAAFASSVFNTTGAAPFTLDGVADSQGYKLSNAGAVMPLYVAMRGTTIYVATTAPGPGGSNDHFIMLDGGLHANPMPAPWAKAGFTPFRSNAAFLGAEFSNNYIGWFNAYSGANTYRGSSGQLMEGTIDRSSILFPQKQELLICALAYQNADGGLLVGQTPAMISNSGNVDPLELLSIPLDALRDEDSNGVFDRLEPHLDFRVSALRKITPSLYSISWNCFPKRTYKIQTTTTLNGDWNFVPSPGSGNDLMHTALSNEIQTSVTITLDPAEPRRFFRVVLTN